MSKLVNCKACGKEVSKSAKCPHCGKDQRNFFAKHKIITTILVLAVLGGIGSNLNNKDDGTSTSNSSTGSKQASTTETKKEETKKELSKTGEASSVVFEVKDLSTSGEIGKNQYAKKTASGVYKIITLNVTNNQKDAITVDSNLFKLVDDQNREFDASSEAQTALSVDGNEGLFLKKVNPGLSVEGKIAFDVPKDAKIVKLKARGGMTGKTVELKVE